MSERDPKGGPEGGPDVDPAVEHVRAALAGLGSPSTGETMPPRVVARLERTLEDLIAERGDAGASPEPDKRVVPLRAPWLPRAAAAAAVVVVAAGVASGVFHGLQDTTTTSSKAGAGAAADPRTASEPPASAPGLRSEPGSASRTLGLPTVSRVAFGDQVARLLRDGEVRAPAVDAAGGGSSPSPGAAQGLANRVGCRGPRVADGAARTPVALDGRPAVLLVHPARHGARLAEVWSCSGATRLASARVAP